jgi:hypothetical protein
MTDATRSVERAIRIYQMLIKAYPASFHKEYADEMALVFRELAADAWRQRGRAGLLILWFRIAADLLRSVPKEHLLRRKSHEGEIAMNLKSLLTRQILSDKAATRWGLIVGIPVWLVFLSFGVKKLISMDMTGTQLFFVILPLALLMLQMICIGLLSPLEPKHPSRLSVNYSQIAILAVAVVVLILGVWGLSFLAIQEYELFVGMFMLFNMMMALILMGLILPILQAARRERREKAADY